MNSIRALAIRVDMCDVFWTMNTVQQAGRLPNLEKLTFRHSALLYGTKNTNRRERTSLSPDILKEAVMQLVSVRELAIDFDDEVWPDYRREIEAHVKEIVAWLPAKVEGVKVGVAKLKSEPSVFGM